MNETLEKILKDLTKRITEKLGIRVYMAIANPNGIILSIQDRLEPFKNLIENFVGTNFPYLSFGDHSVPISGHNILFYRLNKGIIVLYSPKGRIGQFLTTKSILAESAEDIDQEIGDVIFDQKVLTKKIIEQARPELIYKRNIWNIIPLISVKLSGKEKLPLDEAIILNKLDGKKNISEIAEIVQKKETDITKLLLKYYQTGWIKFPNYKPFSFDCPSCKTKRSIFIPKYSLEKTPSEYIRMQIASLECEHTFTVFIDKKEKIKSEKIEFFTQIINNIDFFNLSIDKLLEFFGRDIFFNIFHSLITGKSIILLNDEVNGVQIVELLTNFMRLIFPNLSQEIQTLPLNDYLKNWKKLKDVLIIDLAHNLTVNEPHDKEKFEAEATIFKLILTEKETKNQILKTNQEFERLLLLIEPIIQIVDNEKKTIVEADLIEKIQEQFGLELRIQEIPLLKDLAKIYYDVDISKKVVSELAYSIW